ncbi:MAG: ABC transporter ATP-binding protein [Ethanoligenens sp.]
MESILSVRGLTKEFKSRPVLKGLDFQIQKGEVLCLLGPNGAGKSTTINILSSTLPYDGGEVLYHGQPVRKRLRSYKRKIGMVPQDISLYEELSPEQNLRFFSSLYGLSKERKAEAVEKALVFAGLEDRRKDAVRTFSGGMKRRLNIACAIVHDPELVIMDEPTVGIDAQSRNYILQTINDLRERGMTILYTTHYMKEVEAISTRVIIIDHGQIIAEGSKESLIQNYQNKITYSLETDDTGNLKPDDFDGICGVLSSAVSKNQVTFTVQNTGSGIGDILNILHQKQVGIKKINSSEANLETVFLDLTGRKLRD